MKNKKEFIQKEIDKVNKHIESLISKSQFLQSKLQQESVIETVLVADVSKTEQTIMDTEKSKGLVKQDISIESEVRKDELIYEFVRNGSNIKCIIRCKETHKIEGQGFTRCHWDDKFDYRKGIMISKLRAEQDLLKRLEKQYY